MSQQHMALRVRHMAVCVCACLCVCVRLSLRFSRFYFAGEPFRPDAQEPLVSLAPKKTLIIGCVNVPAGTPWAPLCAAWVPTRTSIFNPVSLAHMLSDAFDAITNGHQTLKNEMSNMPSQVCAGRVGRFQCMSETKHPAASLEIYGNVFLGKLIASLLAVSLFFCWPVFLRAS